MFINKNLIRINIIKHINKLMQVSKSLITISILNFFVLLLACFFAIEFGYGIESEPLLTVFINIIENGEFSTSRYHGHPVSEILIGFSGYIFGGKVTNFICFCLYNISLYLFYLTFDPSTKNKNTLVLFLILCFSNSLIFLQSSEVSDFPVALFFLSLGFFLFSKKQKELSIIVFSLCIASRAHFFLYIFGFILFYSYLNKSSLKENIKYIVLLFFVSSLFFLPVFYESKLSLSIFSNVGGPDLILSQLLPRFTYKIYKMIGVFSSIIIFIYIVIKLKTFFISIKKEKYLTLIIVLNLITFFLMPTKYAILQPALISFYLIISKYFNKKIIFLIIILNIFEWFFSYQILEIRYKYAGVCFGGTKAIGATINFSIDKGNLSKHYEKLSRKECWAAEYYKGIERHKNYINDLKLKKF